MSDEREPEEQQGDDAPEGGKINDPLTRTDVEAPRVPFGSDTPEEE